MSTSSNILPLSLSPPPLHTHTHHPLLPPPSFSSHHVYLNPLSSPLQIQMHQQSGEAKYSGPIDCAKKLYREGGIRSVYRGTFATLLRGNISQPFKLTLSLSPHSPLSLLPFLCLITKLLPLPQMSPPLHFSLVHMRDYCVTSHQKVKGWRDCSHCYLKQHLSLSLSLPPPSRDKVSPGYVLLAGGTAGIANWLSCIAQDTVKSRYQTAPSGKYSGLGQVLMEIVCQ